MVGFFDRLEGSTTFRNNRANRAAGIFNLADLSTFRSDAFEGDEGREYEVPQISFPEDTVFENNDANVRLRSDMP